MLTGIAAEKIVALQWVAVIGASLLAAVYDFRTRRIPNAITLPLLAAGLIQAALFGGVAGFAEATGACVLLALPYVLMFLFANGGAGDAKLMGAIGAWLGLRQGIIVLCCVAAAGIVLGLAKAAAQKRLKVVLVEVVMCFYGFILFLMGYKRKQHAADEAGANQSYTLTIPYGIAILAGVCAGGGFVVLW